MSEPINNPPAFPMPSGPEPRQNENEGEKCHHVILSEGNSILPNDLKERLLSELSRLQRENEELRKENERLDSAVKVYSEEVQKVGELQVRRFGLELQLDKAVKALEPFSPIADKFSESHPGHLVLLPVVFTNGTPPPERHLMVQDFRRVQQTLADIKKGQG